MPGRPWRNCRLLVIFDGAERPPAVAPSWAQGQGLSIKRGCLFQAVSLAGLLGLLRKLLESLRRGRFCLRKGCRRYKKSRNAKATAKPRLAARKRDHWPSKKVFVKEEKLSTRIRFSSDRLVSWGKSVRRNFRAGIGPGLAFFAHFLVKSHLAGGILIASGPRISHIELVVTRHSLRSHFHILLQGRDGLGVPPGRV